MLTHVTKFKKLNVTKKLSKSNIFSKTTKRNKSDDTYSALMQEFSDNLDNVLKHNRYTESDKAFSLFSSSVKGRKEVLALDYFRGLHSVTQAFAETKGANTPEVRKLISTFSDLLKQSQIQSDSTIEPVKVAVTGAAGAIGYAALFRIASGDLLGKNVPIKLHLLEIPQSLSVLEGVVMELNDCAFPLLRGIEVFSDAEQAFEDIDFALLIGAQPRTKGMERADLLKKNGDIFSVQGKALNKSAKKTVKVVVVGNPANTNCLIASHNAPNIPPENFSAMTRLDHNRGLSQLSTKLNIGVKDIENFAVWGNHSSTQFPSIEHCLIKGKPARQVINDDAWISNTFIPVVQNRGAEIIKARGASSAASAASSCLDHIRDWVNGTGGEWTSMAIHSQGEYGVTPGLFYSYPVTTNGSFNVVQNLQIDPSTAEKLETTHQELLKERDDVSSLLQ